MRAGKIVNIECQCGVLLFRYYKAGKGKIIRCYISRMEKDFVGVGNLPTLHKPLCLNCQKELGIIMMIKGEVALKLNQGTIKGMRI
jgi:hypothetical protein